jgi:hypothetical protein
MVICRRWAEYPQQFVTLICSSVRLFDRSATADHPEILIVSLLGNNMLERDIFVRLRDVLFRF